MVGREELDMLKLDRRGSGEGRCRGISAFNGTIILVNIDLVVWKIYNLVELESLVNLL